MTSPITGTMDQMEDKFVTKQRSTKSQKPQEVTYHCEVVSWGVSFASGAYGQGKATFFEESRLVVSGRMVPPFRGAERIEVNIVGNDAGIRGVDEIGRMAFRDDFNSATVEVSAAHFSTLMAGFAAGKNIHMYLVVARVGRRVHAPVTTMTFSTTPDEIFDV
jgi:hypothetical protein